MYFLIEYIYGLRKYKHKIEGDKNANHLQS